MPSPTQSAPASFAEATVRLRDTLPGYEERTEQTRLATAIEQSIQDGSILLAQAGTGTGKSLASLIPAILSGDTVVYSTASKALQSQIVEKDLPFLAEHLGVPFTFAMLQGRKNYLCRERLVNSDKVTPSDIRPLLSVVEASDASDVKIIGLRDDFGSVDEATWSAVTVTSDDCLGKECLFYDNCYATLAKQKAAASNVVVVNHALLMSDTAVRVASGGAASILPGYVGLIVDEAHELEQYATNALAFELRPKSIVTFAGDFATFVRRHATEWIDEADDIRGKLATANESLFHLLGRHEGRLRHRWFVDNAEAFLSVNEALLDAKRVLDEIAIEFERTDFIERKLVTLLQRNAKRVDNLSSSVMGLLMKTDTEVVRFVESNNFGVVLKSLPVRVGPWLAENLWPDCTPVLLSATLFMGGSADYVIDRYGLDIAEREVRMVDAGTPFDYDKQLVLYVPGHISEPTPKLKAQWTDEMIPLVIELVKASRGRALLLFTSNAQMRDVHAKVARHIDYPVKKQGDEPTPALTRWFRETTDGVLFATRSFFTGIDIQGESLSLVVIDKLPFPVPTDPVIEARSEEVEARGLSAFGDYTVPIMTLTLLQAHGRLIRTKQDKGVVAILDPRLWTKGYGKTIMRALPGVHSRDLNDVDRMFS